jgi:hypothetical protein
VHPSQRSLVQAKRGTCPVRDQPMHVTVLEGQRAGDGHHQHHPHSRLKRLRNQRPAQIRRQRVTTATSIRARLEMRCTRHTEVGKDVPPKHLQQHQGANTIHPPNKAVRSRDLLERGSPWHSSRRRLREGHHIVHRRAPRLSLRIPHAADESPEHPGGMSPETAQLPRMTPLALESAAAVVD